MSHTTRISSLQRRLRIISLLAACLLFLAGTADAQRYTLTFRDGNVRADAQVRGYDTARQRLKVNYQGKDRDVDIKEFRMIVKTGAAAPSGVDSLDTIVLADGKSHRGYFRDWNAQQVTLALPGTGIPKLQQLPSGGLAAVYFGAAVPISLRRPIPSPNRAQYWIRFYDGEIRTDVLHRGFDDKTQQLEVRYLKKDRKIDMNECISIALDGVQPPSGVDTLDTVLLRDGSTAGGYASAWKKKTLALGAPGRPKDRRQIASDKVAAIRFGPKVLLVHRWDFDAKFAGENESKEIALGAQYAEELKKEMFIVQDPGLQQYIQSLGERLVVHSMRPGLDYKFHIINDNVVNAFAVPGGHIYFYRGLIEMTETEDELAGVMAHEISHIVGRHSMQQMKSQRNLGFAALGGAILGAVVGGRLGEAIYYGSNMTTNLFMMKYSRDDEREADFLGIYALYQTGYNPSGMSSLFEKFGKLRESQPSAMESWFQTHPQPAERVQNARKEQAKLPERTRYLDRATEFARMKKTLAQQDKPFEVREKPGEFVTITQPRWEQNTNAWVTIANKSKYKVSHLGVYVNYVDRAGKSLDRVGLLVREEPLPPGQSCEINIGQAIRDNAKVQADHVTVELAQAIPRP